MKRTTTTGYDWTGQLVEGQIGINLTDKTIHFVDGGGTIREVKDTSQLDAEYAALVHTHDQEDIAIVNQIGSPTVFTNIRDFMDYSYSSGMIEGGDITDNGNGTIDIADGHALLRTSDSPTAPLVNIKYSGTTGLALTDNDVNWIMLDYNGGSPTISATVNRGDLNCRDNCMLAQITRFGNNLNIIDHRFHNIDFNRASRVKMFKTEGFIRSLTGTTIGGTGNRYITMTEGEVYEAATSIAVSSFDSSGSDTFTTWYRDGVGGWTSNTSITQIDNANYDDGSGTLAAVAGARYGVHWVFLVPGTNGSSIHVLYGTGNYTASEYPDAEAPSELPPVLNGSSVLIAKIVIGSGDSSFTSIEDPRDTQFQGAGVSDHNALSNLQGGTTDEYYHLTSAELSLVTNAVQPGDNISTLTNNSGYITGVAWGDVTGTLSNQTDLQSALDGKSDTSHVHEGTEIDATGITDGYVLTADGAGNAAWEAVPAGGSVALNDLTDVDTSGVTDGYVLTYQAGSPTGWVAAEATGGGGGSSTLDGLTDTNLTPAVSARYWRLHVTAYGGSTFLQINEIEMKESIGGSDVCSGGTVIKSGEYNDTSWAASNAFDDDTGTGWLVSFGTGPQWIGYDFGSGNDKTITEYTIYCVNSGRIPVDWTLQYSDNGTDWTTLDTQSSISWSVPETKTFNYSNGIPTDSFLTFDGSKWVDNPSPTISMALDDLSNVDLTGSPGPAADDVLTFDGSKWVPLSIQASIIDSESATDGYVLTSDGAGGAAWEAVSGGGGGDAYIEHTYDGTAPTASGTDSLAIGEGASVVENYNVAIGPSTQSLKGEGNVVIGRLATCNNSSSFQPSVAIGSQAEATGYWTTAIGVGTDADGVNSTAIGAFAQATYGNNIAIGDADATGDDSAIAIGDGSLSSAANAISIGKNSRATEKNSSSFGYYSRAVGQASTSIGTGINAMGYFTPASIILNLNLRTADDTPARLTWQGQTFSSSNDFIIPNKSSILFHGFVVGKVDESQTTGAYEVKFLITKGTSSGSTTLEWSSVTALFEDSSAWDVSVSADTTNGTFDITATGEAATTVFWTCTLNGTVLTETSF